MVLTSCSNSNIIQYDNILDVVYILLSKTCRKSSEDEWASRSYPDIKRPLALAYILHFY